MPAIIRPRRAQSAGQYKIDADLVRHVAAQPAQRLGYAVIRGTVQPLGPPIRSVMSPSVTGVLQVINLSEHQAARGVFGMWVEQTKLIHTSANEVPFALTAVASSSLTTAADAADAAVRVEVIDALSAALLDLDVVYDNYEPVSNSFFDNLFGFFLGVRQQGMQTTEEVLRDGSFITAVGELELYDNGQLRLQPSSAGPMMLTTATKNTILRRLADAKSRSLVRVVVFGAIGAGLTAYIVRKLWLRRRARLEEEALAEALEKSRQARREKARTTTNGGGGTTPLSEDQVCVVCVTHPKEVNFEQRIICLVFYGS